MKNTVDIRPCKIDGCYELLPQLFHDHRGVFVKTFHSFKFEQLGLDGPFQEQYYSKSRKSVLRGMHFQTPPYDHAKLVYCTDGEVLDVVLDLRKDSSTFGQYVSFELNAALGNMIYIPKGLAHGFYVKSEQATLIYNVTTVYRPEHDQGIHWKSFDMNWPDPNPVISERDANFIGFKDYTSPF